MAKIPKYCRVVLGSGIGFADGGRHTLKRVPDNWQLFAVEHT